jgi:hypothetical protein
MRSFLKVLCCLWFLAVVGCGSGYKSREAAPGSADPNAVMKQMGKNPAPSGVRKKQ